MRERTDTQWQRLSTHEEPGREEEREGDELIELTDRAPLRLVRRLPTCPRVPQALLDAELSSSYKRNSCTARPMPRGSLGAGGPPSSS